MEIRNKAISIDLFNFKTPQMRAFHMSWFAFFLCFFSWFGIAPLMAIVREELSLSKTQIGNTIIASVAITIIARLFIGWLCDKIGPRKSYTWLLVLGSIPVMGIGFAQSYETFLLFRLAIGAIGASFVITQYHTSVMFAANCVGTANATSAGWGNLGGGVTQMIMPLVYAGFIGSGLTAFWSWRLSMFVAGLMCLLTGLAYYKLTTDLPDGNFDDPGLRDEKKRDRSQPGGGFLDAVKDYRSWSLFFVYAACFGIELTVNNIMALYFTDYFGLGVKTAGLVAGLFGLMNIFARTTGGIIGDKFGALWGTSGRIKWLFLAVLIEGVALIIFSRMTVLPLAIGVMIIFSLFTQMAEGATFSVVPFINKKALGSVSGIVGAGGNMGAVAAGFLIRSPDIDYQTALLILGFIVIGLAFFALTVRFSPEEKAAAAEEQRRANEQRRAMIDAKPVAVQPVFVRRFERLVRSFQPLDLIRTFFGAALAVKGIFFIINIDAFEKMTGYMGALGDLTAWYVIIAHVIGGMAIFLGVGTRLASAVNIPVLFGAIFLAHERSGIFDQNQDFQFSVLVLVMLIAFVWSGDGKFSLKSLLGPGSGERSAA